MRFSFCYLAIAIVFACASVGGGYYSYERGYDAAARDLADWVKANPDGICLTAKDHAK